MKIKYEVEIDTEDSSYLVNSWLDARARGDHEEAKRIFRKVPLEASTLMVGKKLFGADYIRKEGLNTEKADAKYGPDWLDKDDGPPEIKRKMF